MGFWLDIINTFAVLFPFYFIHSLIPVYIYIWHNRKFVVEHIFICVRECVNRYLKNLIELLGKPFLVWFYINII